MTPRPHSSDSPKVDFLSRIAAMRFFSVSLLIHSIIVLFGGSIVIIKSVVEAPDFVGGDGELVASAEGAPDLPPEAPRPQEIPQFQSPTPEVSAPTLDAIVTNANLTSFQINAAVPLATLNGPIGTAPMSGKGMGDKLAGLASGGMRGGTRGFFGMRATKESQGIGLTGTFYDAKQTRARKPSEIDVGKFGELITKFVDNGWKESVLNDCYKAPNTLTTTQIFIPNMSANEGPKAFDADKEVQPSRWLVHYRGRISPPRDGNFRFVGAGDDYLVVRLNNKLVLDHGFYKATDWKPDKYYNYGWTGVPNGFARGEKFRAVASQYYDIEVLISERPGGLVFFCLMIEDQDMEYSKDAKGNPILPVFRLADGPMPELEKGQTLPPYDPKAPIWKSQPIRSGSGFSQMFGPK